MPTLELTAKHDIPVRINAMNLKNGLRDIETNGRYRSHLAPPNLGARQHPIDGACRIGGGAVNSIKSRLSRCKKERHQGQTMNPDCDRLPTMPLRR
jgi:hypothetical protein